MSERAKLADKVPERGRENPVPPIRKTESPQSISSPVDKILFHQRTIGNRAVERLFKSGIIQPKLKISQPGDIYEQDADFFQSLGPGHPLDPARRTFVESSFDHDFNQVRLHTDAKAAESAQAVGARAFTVGRDIVFGAGQYSPDTNEGRRLLAHELVHVVQQRALGAAMQRQTVPEPEAIPWRLGGTLPYREAVEALERERMRGPAFVVDMSAPSRDPRPDHSRTTDDLGAWEKAIFQFTPVADFDSRSTTMPDGGLGSYVTSVSYRLRAPRFRLFIAREIWDNWHDRTRSDRLKWQQIYFRIRTHARQHFTRYRETVTETRTEILSHIRGLPRISDPLGVPKHELDAYVNRLIRYLTARLHYKLWDTTCSWEREDYPRLLRGIPSVHGMLTPTCDPAPRVPPRPMAPIPVLGRP